MGIPRIDDVTGVVDGVNRVFTTPNPYVSGTLVVMVNGRQRDRDLENGWTELDPAIGTFEMNVAPLPPQGAVDDVGDLVSAYYDNADERAGGGSEGGVPRIVSGDDVRPKICASDDLAPELSARTDDERIPCLSAGEIRPKICRTIDVRPRIEKAEEI